MNTFIKRFEAKYIPDPNSGCWLWVAATLPTGYGQFWFRGRRRNAHRASFEYFNGQVPNGCEVHHKCNTRCCVNPDHLVAISHRENTRLGEGEVGRNARKTHCKKGHQFSKSNTYVSPRGTRHCRTCLAARQRDKRRK